MLFQNEFCVFGKDQQFVLHYSKIGILKQRNKERFDCGEN